MLLYINVNVIMFKHRVVSNVRVNRKMCHLFKKKSKIRALSTK